MQALMASPSPRTSTEAGAKPGWKRASFVASGDGLGMGEGKEEGAGLGAAPGGGERLEGQVVRIVWERSKLSGSVLRGVW